MSKTKSKLFPDVEYQRLAYVHRQEKSKTWEILHYVLYTLTVLSFLICAVIISTILYKVYMLCTPQDRHTIKVQLQCSIEDNNRFDCWPEKSGATPDLCSHRGCCWKPSSKPNTAPYCFYPATYNGYNATQVKETETGLEATLLRHTSSVYSHDVKEIKLQVDFQTDSRLRIKFYDPNNHRYEVPLAVPSSTSKAANPQYNVTIIKAPFSITVTRKSTGEKIFDTANTAPLIFSDQFLQIATKLSTKYVYGLGEHRNNFLIDLAKWERYVFWNRDDIPKLYNNGYGSHPFFLNLENGRDSNMLGTQSNSHGVFLLNSNAGEVAFQPFGDEYQGAVVYRFLGGILDFFIVTGPEPGAITPQLVDIIGRPYLPPFWSLGFHLCRWGYNSSRNLSIVIKRNRDAKMPYAALQPGAVTYRMLGGVLDFFIVMGPQAESVVISYVDIIGRPYLPPFWSLGFHICKYGIHDDQALKAMIDRNRAAKMPYDVQWNDIDYMDGYKDWTFDPSRYKELPSIVSDLHKNQQRYIIMADPAIASSEPAGSYPPFDDGKKLDVFVKNSDGEILIGKVWPGETAFPDFFHPNAADYWYQQAKSFHDKVPFDGLWIDMNEPSNFVQGSVGGCPASLYNDPPYTPATVDSGNLMAKTICPSAKQAISVHYNLHNMYGWSQANVSRKVLNRLYQGKRSPIITRSTFPGSGVNAGHWLGDNLSSFTDLFYSISGIMNFNLFGLPQVGVDICGFRGATTPELCTRWMQLGAFYPFMRNHADINSADQDPGSFSSPYKDYMRSALQLRYSLLAVLYTNFYQAHTQGLPIVRPLMFYYKNTEAIDRQFLWGDQLMISPVLYEGSTTVDAFFPDDVWYDFYKGTRMSEVGKFVTLAAPLDHINVHIKGGSILPLLPPTQRTDLSRLEKFQVVCAPDSKGNAVGSLFWDDGDSLDSVSSKNYTEVKFSMNSYNSFSSHTIESGYHPEKGLHLGQLTVLDVQSKPQQVTLNGKKPNFTYDAATKRLIVVNLDEDLTNPITGHWS